MCVDGVRVTFDRVWPSIKEGGDAMIYTAEEIKSLIEHFNSYGGTYFYVSKFFQVHMSDIQAWGLKESGSVASAFIVQELKTLFPDVYFALTMPEKDLPLYLDQKVGLEYPIAVWRLRSKRASV
jgi:hypothetical protein